MRSKSWADYPHRKDEQGRNLCRWCSSIVPKPRRTFCSQKCVDDLSIRTTPSVARNHVFLRDRGVCAICGKDCLAIEKRQSEIKAECGYDWVKSKKMQREEGIDDGRYTHWDMDHIVEVVNGGGGCGLDNLQTLCVPCHKAKTAKLAASRAKSKQGAANAKP